MRFCGLCDPLRKGRAQACAEQGGSVVAFVVSLPILLVFLCGVLDVGRAVFLRVAVDDAAHAACAAVSTAPAGGATPIAYDAALRAAPALGAEGLAMRVVVEYEAEEVVSYDHHVYVDAGESFETRPVRLLRQPVEVAVRLEGRYLTPIGNALAAVAGNVEGRFSYESRSAGAVVEG